MQEHTKKDSQQDIKNVQRGAGPVHIVQTSRLNGSGPDALREAHMNLVRAEQNLYNLVQASQATTGSQFGPSAGFGYPTQQAFPAGYTAPGYSPGFAPPAAFSTPAALAYGMAPTFNPWGPAPQSAIAPWSPWQTAIPASPGSLNYAPGFAQGAFASSPIAFAAGIASRTPACDIVDEGKQFVCQLELPGVKAEQVELLCFERAVVINAFREAEGDIASLVQSERGNATQQRAITLPNGIQPGSCRATLSNGILTVVLPKVHPTEGPQRIEVQG
jgi:HSP20 family protein